MNIQLPDFSRRYDRIKWGVIAISVLLFFLLIRILKIRYDVNQTAAHPDKNVKAFLQLIRWCEGTDGPNGYKTMFGGKLFSSFADLPRSLQHNRSTAAGAYQFMPDTWDECRRILGLPDFSPASQDKAAIYLIDKRRKALGDIQAGKLTSAIYKCSWEWASMPGPNGQARYPNQSVRSLAAIRSKFAELGGVANS